MQLSDAEIERLRTSGIRLDREGRFWHEGGEVTHAGLKAALYRWLSRNPDGRYVLRLDADRFVYIDVEETPFVVRSLRWEGDRAHLVLSDGSEEELAYESLRLRPGTIPHVTVKGRFEARVSASAWSVLAERVTS